MFQDLICTLDLIPFVLVFRIASFFQIPFLLSFFRPGLYQGWFPVISSLWCSNFVYFYSYNFLKLVFYGKAKPTPLKDIWAASLAGMLFVPTNYLQQFLGTVLCMYVIYGHIWTILSMHIHSWWKERQLFHVM